MNEQFSVLYNGKPTEITCMPDNIFYIQITTTPFIISYSKNDEGNLVWLEVEDKRQTWLSDTLGGLIEEYYANENLKFQ